MIQIYRDQSEKEALVRIFPSDSSSDRRSLSFLFNETYQTIECALI